MATTCHLVFLETSGNQAYIFGSNKLRENVGASELVYRAGTEFVLDAVRRLGGPDLWDTTNQRPNPSALCDSRRNPAIETGSQPFEVLLATSGKAEILVRERASGVRLVEEVTASVLREAPGVEVVGVVSPPFTLEQPGALHRAVCQVHAEYEEVRSRCPGAGERFQRLPFVAECATSGLPAACFDEEGPEQEGMPRSATSLAKRRWTKEGVGRMAALLHEHRKDLFARNPNDLEKLDQLDWLAVVHADGNGLGEIFLSFAEHCGASTHRQYIDSLRRFSLALDQCTAMAFHRALRAIPKSPRGRHRWPDTLQLVPLVIGGDDLTVICNGQVALEFTAAFLEAFEEETGKSLEAPLRDILPQIARRALGAPYLSSCAGVAVVKPHYPFFSAYHLAEELLKSAKKVKSEVQGATGKPYPCSALDFHVLYDASGADLEVLRQRMRPSKSEVRLYARPYVVTPPARVSGAASGEEWIEPRRWPLLCERVTALLARDEEGRRRLPSSQMHDLRAGLHLGKDEADARLRLIHVRYAQSGLDTLLPAAEVSLFATHPEEGKTVTFSPLLDAIDAAEFIQGTQP